MQSSNPHIRLVTADSRQFVPTLEDNSIQAAVTDPPYELNFMGHEWDRSGVAFDEQLWKTILDKLTHGAHLIAFAHTTTFDLVCSAIRRAGFEIRDMLLWHQGQGFPKGKSISKAIDKKLGLHATAPEIPIENYPPLWERKKTAKMDITSGGFHAATDDKERATKVRGFLDRPKFPVSSNARYWYDWHTLLKPTTEPAVLARKPIEKGLTEEENILKWGTGSLNIGACRVAVNSKLDSIGKTTTRKGRVQTTVFSDSSCGYDNEQNTMAGVLPSGRFASNLVLSHHPDCILIQEGTTTAKSSDRKAESTTKHGIYGKDWIRNPDAPVYDDIAEIWACVPGCPVRMIDDIAGRKRSGGSISGNEPSSKSRDGPIYGLSNRSAFQGYQDQGGVSRFFYCAKASPNERNLGLPEGERNPHVAVKPINLLRYYIRLVTPPGGTILDPFLGSGSTAIAALLEDFNLIGVEIDPNHMRTSRLRLEYWKKNPVNPLKPPVKRPFKQQPDQTNLQNYF